MRIALLLALSIATPAMAADPPVASPAATRERLSDAELARQTGKFILPNGVALALSVTSDTLLNGVPVLRTVLTIDDASRLQVFGRNGDAPAQTMRVPGAAAAAATGVNVLFDRQSGTRTVTPSFTVGAGTTVIGAAPDATAAGLTPLDVAVGAPAVRTPDGVVSLAQTATGAQVTLAGDQLGIAHLVGRSVATAVLNSANDRTFDTVTSIDIDLRDVTPYALGAAALRVDDLALDATRGMVR